ncbi:MAG: hypothetical protein G01um101470_210 [Parcubacteria group bacterium Gr01-1014_70]|nr:MAG: hypothetical protein G01um101470_210 [Parcubacteria group bacterium Gr01-1014_70]
MNALTENQKRFLEKVRMESRHRAQRVIQHAKLRKNQKRKLRLARQKLEHSDIVINLNLDKQYRDEKIIDSLLRIGRMFNRIEVEDFPDGIHNLTFRTRLLVEFKLYGATQDLQVIFSHMHDSERPNYGGLDYLQTPTSIAPLRHYGHYRFVLKNELRINATFTPFDSFLVEREQVYVWDDIEGVLATKLNGRFWFDYVLDEIEPVATDEGVHYIEAQILGGVHLSDITRLYYPVVDQTDYAFFAKLKQFEIEHNIQIVQY